MVSVVFLTFSLLAVGPGLSFAYRFDDPNADHTQNGIKFDMAGDRASCLRAFQAACLYHQRCRAPKLQSRSDAESLAFRNFCRLIWFGIDFEVEHTCAVLSYSRFEVHFGSDENS